MYYGWSAMDTLTAIILVSLVTGMVILAIGTALGF